MCERGSEISPEPTFRNRLYLLRRFIERRGLRGLILRGIDTVARRQPTKPDRPETTAPSDLEQRFGPRCAADLRIQSGNVRWTLPYQPSREELFRKALARVTVRHPDYVFVDIGAGKGFVLLLAAEYPFRSVIGIEFSETLAQIALDNIRTDKDVRKCQNIRCVCMDATQFTLPAEPAVLYLFNPFQGRVMDRMIQCIKDSLRQNPRDLWIVYVNPWEDRKFRRSREFELIESTGDYSVYRAAGAPSAR